MDIVKNNLTNLIPIVNPALKIENGIKLAIMYRVLPTIEIDSSELVKEAYKKLYGENIPESADTIFNAFIPFLDFCRAKLILLNHNVSNLEQEKLLRLVYLHLDEIFNGYSDLESLFNRYFDLMYSFSNMMPVPKYFNGSDNKNGKGTWELNKDYPSIYYKNLEDEESSIDNVKEMKKWLDENMKKYRVEQMYMLEPPYPISEYYGYNDDKLDNLISFIKNAIRLIEDRFN